LKEKSCRGKQKSRETKKKKSKAQGRGAGGGKTRCNFENWSAEPTENGVKLGGGREGTGKAGGTRRRGGPWMPRITTGPETKKKNFLLEPEHVKSKRERTGTGPTGGKRFMEKGCFLS